MARGETYEEFVAKFNKEKPKTTDDLSVLTRWTVDNP